MSQTNNVWFYIKQWILSKNSQQLLIQSVIAKGEKRNSPLGSSQLHLPS